MKLLLRQFKRVENLYAHRCERFFSKVLEQKRNIEQISAQIQSCEARKQELHEQREKEGLFEQREFTLSGFLGAKVRGAVWGTRRLELSVELYRLEQEREQAQQHLKQLEELRNLALRKQEKWRKRIQSTIKANRLHQIKRDEKFIEDHISWKP